jgi:hypothetical protein
MSGPVKVSQTNLTIRFQIDARLAGTLAPPGARSPFIGTRSVDWILARDASGPVKVSPAQSHLVKPVWGSGKGDIWAARQRPPYQWEMVFVLVGQPAVNVRPGQGQSNQFDDSVPDRRVARGDARPTGSSVSIFWHSF